MWVYWICDTQTGQKDLQVEPISGRWQRKLVGFGSGSHTFQVVGSDYPRETWRDLLKDDWSRTLVVSWQDPDRPEIDYPLYAGIITATDPADDGTVTVEHSEFRMFLDVRLPFTTFSNEPIRIYGRSQRGIIAQVMVLALNGPSRRALPVMFPFFDEAGGHDLTIHQYEFKTVEEIVQDAQDAVDGVDLEFRQQWDYESKLQWELRAGTPTLSGPLLEFTVTSAEPGQLSYSTSQDGSKVATAVWTVGKGSGEDMRHGVATLGGTSPAKERVRTYKDQSDQGVLNSLALDEANVYVLPTEQPSLTVPASTAIAQGFELGSPVRLLFDGHWWEFDGAKNMRLVGYGSDGSDKLDFDVQGA